MPATDLDAALVIVDRDVDLDLERRRLTWPQTSTHIVDLAR